MIPNNNKKNHNIIMTKKQEEQDDILLMQKVSASVLRKSEVSDETRSASKSAIQINSGSSLSICLLSSSFCADVSSDSSTQKKQKE